VTGSLLVLLPPSEAKNPGGSLLPKIGSFDEELAEPRREIIAALGRLFANGSHTNLEKTLKVRGPLLGRATDATRDLLEGRARLLPGWRRYSGVVWAHLEPERLSAAQRRRILVPSGLYGMTTAEDKVADYRLKMNSSLAPMGNVAAFWKPYLTPVLLERFSGARIVNLLPKEHEAAFDLREINRVVDLVTIHFVSHNGQGAAGHAAKAVKGLVASEILNGRLDQLESFRWQGWRARRSEGQLLLVAPRP
jgi:hypothetical protein